jgi:hypothetical protein
MLRQMADFYNSSHYGLSYMKDFIQFRYFLQKETELYPSVIEGWIKYIYKNPQLLLNVLLRCHIYSHRRP